MNRLQTASRLSRVLLRLTTVVVLLNGASAFGACCFELPTADEVAVELPCHQKEEATSTHASDCCMTCVSVVVADTADGRSETFQPAAVPVSLGGPSDRQETLFRPPISHLS